MAAGLRGMNAIRPYAASLAPTRRAANGVVLRHEADRDTYDLPVGRDGVARHVEVTDRPWWRGGTRVEAQDGAGHSLCASAYRHEVILVDAVTGITTTLNCDSLDLDVAAKPQISSHILPGGSEHVWRTPLTEHLAADGTVTVRTDRETHKIIHWAAGPTAAATPPIALSDAYQETVVDPRGLPITAAVTQDHDDPPKRSAALACMVDQSGVLTIVGADGSEQTHELLIPLHAMAGVNLDLAPTPGPGSP